MSVLVMVVGRLLDIFEYYIYRDNKYELPNREGCDHYMASFRKLLPDSFSCITFKLSDIQQKNNKFGRDKTDEMIRNFANILKQTFGANDDCFLAVNGIGQFVVLQRRLLKSRPKPMQELSGMRSWIITGMKNVK